MATLLFWIAALGAAALVFGLLGAWIADQKRRNPLEGLVVGALFGPLGALVEALLPVGSYPSSPPPDLTRFVLPPEPASKRPAAPEAIRRLRLD